MKLVLVFAVIIGIACGPKRKNQCPTNVAGPCAFGSEVCSFDRTRNCQVCQCQDIGGSTKDMTQPDTNGLPPEPVH